MARLCALVPPDALSGRWGLVLQTFGNTHDVHERTATRDTQPGHDGLLGPQARHRTHLEIILVPHRHNAANAEEPTTAPIHVECHGATHSQQRIPPSLFLLCSPPHLATHLPDDEAAAMMVREVRQLACVRAHGRDEALPVLRNAMHQSSPDDVGGHAVPRQALNVCIQHLSNHMALRSRAMLEHVLHDKVSEGVPAQLRGACQDLLEQTLSLPSGAVLDEALQDAAAEAVASRPGRHESHLGLPDRARLLGKRSQ
mmetsp:Transcript_132192/g.422922  ORF Transcript_132192/g.422922 Transcript_132192/m.422922 type:complete len:256 (-) Transcript_132192:110-877(-)